MSDMDQFDAFDKGSSLFVFADGEIIGVEAMSLAARRIVEQVANAVLVDFHIAY